MYIPEDVIWWIVAILFFVSIFAYIAIKEEREKARSQLIYRSRHDTNFYFFHKEHPEYTIEKAEKEYVRLHEKEMMEAIRKEEERARKDFEEWRKEKRLDEFR